MELKKEMKILGVDLETTGLLAPEKSTLDHQPHVIEYGGILYDGTGKTIDKYITLINPPVPIPVFIQKMTGIEEWRCKQNKKFKTYAKKIKKQVESADLFVAHNAMFDATLLKYEFKRLGMDIKLPPLYCTVENSMHIRGIRLKNDELYFEMTGKEAKRSHRAEDDINETMESFFKLTKGAKSCF